MSKYKWYANRLRNMSIQELGYRSYETIKCKAEKVLLHLLKKPLGIDESKIQSNNNLSKFYIELDDRNSIIGFFEENEDIVSNIIENANNALKHRIDIFALKDKFLGDTINWNYDYKNNISTPLKYWAEIDYKDFSQVGDIKYVWEINRFQHIIVLAEAYYLTKKIDYTDEIKKQILSWIEQNPYNIGVNWSSSLELSIRIINWVWAYYLCKEELLLDNAFTIRFVESVHLHLKHIYAHLSRYSSANNHLIGEAAGLVIASVLLHGIPDRRKYIEKGSSILFSEIYKQIYDDGVDKEQAVAYQAFILDFYLLSFLIMEVNGHMVEPDYWSRIEKMCDFISYLIDDNGNVPNIGDSDDGYVIKFSGAKYRNNYLSILNTAAVLFNRPDFIKSKMRFDEKSFWLLGMKGYEKFLSLLPNVYGDVSSKVFDNGGYAIFQGDKEKIIFDCGPLGYLSIAAHGHADALSLNVNYNNNNLIIDPGTYAYHTQQEWRNYFRSTSAHNTITVDKEDQSVIGGNFMWLQKANVHILDHYTGKGFNYISAEHDGYKRLKNPVMHRREILHVKSKYCIISDTLYSEGEHEYNINWHLDSKCGVEYINESTYKITTDNDIVYLCSFSEANIEGSIVKASVNPYLGWQSLRFDEKEATATISYAIRAKGNVYIITLLMFPDKKADNIDLYSVPDCALEYFPEGIKLEWRYGKTQSYCIFSTDLRKFSYNGLSGKVKTLYAEKEGENMVCVFAKDLEDLYMKDTKIYEPNSTDNIFEHSFI